jgi:DNA-directed RNA polymerase specialized sigma24 family protein
VTTRASSRCGAGSDFGSERHRTRHGTPLAELPERYRIAFLLCKEQELTCTQAADVMGVSPATVKTQVARALAALRVSLEPFLTVLLAADAALHR